MFAEQRGGLIRSMAHELLSQGRKLADALETELAAVCFGHRVQGVEELVLTADKVYLLDSPALARYDGDIYVKHLVDLVRQHRPEVVLAGATALGREFIPRVAALLETGLTADCTGLEVDPERRLLVQTKPSFGGNVMATIICETHRPQMATVRPHVFQRGQACTDRKGHIIRVDIKREACTSRTRLLNFVEDLTQRVKLEDAEVIVCGGRGLGGPRDFQIIAELADTLGAAVGSSRPPVDDGWVPYSHQIGQTGKTVRPKLYIACGVSGAVQHLVGMQTSEVIVAINDDPSAPIFDVATYGIVGDLFKIVPLLTERLKRWT